MRRIIGVLAASAAVVIGLSGCAGAPEQTKTAPSEAVAEETPQPLAASPEEAAPEPDSPEEAFLVAVRPFVEESTQIADATDEQLIAAGEDACAQIAAGTLPEEVRVIEDERPNELDYYVDSRRIGLSASRTICP